MKLVKALTIVLGLAGGIFSSPGLAQDDSTISQVIFDFNEISTRSCSGALVNTRWMIGLKLIPSAGCAATISHIATPEPACTDSLEVFEVAFRDGSEPALAESVASNGRGGIFIDTFEPWARSAGDMSSVWSITKRLACRNLLHLAAKVPDKYCTEPRILAVDFNFKAPLNNKVLTNGFSFKIIESGPLTARYHRETFAIEIKNGFQAALMEWSAALADHDELLTPQVRDFILARTYTSDGGYKMLLPPQVVEVKCIQNATFIISLEFENSPILPRYPLILARAKIEGRTIALNMAQFKCFRSELEFDASRNLRFELKDGCLNLIPILTHELGHAFGLGHHDPDPNNHTLMAPSFFRDALSPRPRDVESLVSALERSLTGAIPGELNFMESSGVAPPMGVKEYWGP